LATKLWKLYPPGHSLHLKLNQILKTQLYKLIFGLVLAISPAIPLRAQLVADGGSKAINGTGTNISGALTIGTNGSFTTLLIINGGAVTNSPGGVIGLNSTAKTNQVSVTGTNSTWKVGGTLAVGSAGSFNLLVVSNAGKVFDTVGSIGNSAGGSNNTAVVTDPGSLWTNTLQLMVGPFDSFNRLSISNGAQVFSGGTVIGSDPSQATGGNSNIVILTDPGSAWTNAGKSTVGGGTTGGGEFGCFNQLIISNGAVMRNTLSAPQDHVLANQQYSHNNSMIVTGTNSLFSNRGVGGPGSLFGVGGGGPTNQLLISANGIVETDIGYVGGFVTSSNNSALVTDPGSRWTCTATLYIGNSGSSNQVVVSNSAIIATRNLYVGVASSSNNFLTLAGGNIFATNSLVISNNNFLTGNGAINGNVTNSGTLSPGASIGQIAILGKLTLNASSSNFFEISKTPVTNDNIVGLSNVVYGGILIVTNLSGSLTNGDTFKLFASSNYSGAFSTVILPALSPGLFWTNKLALDGTIRVFNRDPGVDVSHFQGENGISQANWNQMFTEGKRFAFVKATEGFSVLDGTMANNVNRAAGAGLRAGVYHFAHPDTHPTTNGAVQEADYFLSYSGNFIGPGYLRPVLDLEAGSGLSTSNLTDWVIAFCNEIITNRGPSAAPIIYTLQSYATSELDARLTNYDLWIAATGTGLNPATDNPPVTGVFGNWSFWQYNVGSAGGISPIDLDICHSEFKSLDSFLIAAVTNPIAPTITTQPQSRTVRFGNSAAFSVAVSVSSSTPLSYQWQFNGTNIAAATTSVYTRTNSQLTNAGSYTVVITNAAGSITSAVATLTVLNPPPPVPGTVLYSENFDSYSSPSIVTSAGTANGFQIFYSSTAAGFDFSAQFGFNYSGVSSPTTIPSAPHSTNGTTKGLYLTVNKDALSGVAAVNLYPTGQNFTGTFALKFDMWINFPNSGTSTEDALFGINHSGTFTNRVGQIGSDGLFYAMDGDGGVSAGSGTLRDFAVFRGGGSGAIPALLSNTASFGPAPLLGSQFDNADPGFAALFPSKTLSFTTAAGAPGNGWVSVEVRQTTNIITWFLNDTVVAQYANIFGYTNGNILIGYNDNFASPGTADNFAIFDNIRVETVPDIDGNGIADAWEIQYFGQYGIDPDADADGDGMSNLREYYAGTNPTNAASTFRMLSAGKTNNDIRLDWTAVGGHSYVVQSATNSPTGAITNFADLSPVITLSGTNETTTNYTHLGAATNSGGYYRVRLGP
jgi:T5SS/PEP-CTERM-associated repeat protein